MLPSHQLLLHSCNANLQMSPPKMFQTFPNKCHIAVPDLKKWKLKRLSLQKVHIWFYCSTLTLMILIFWEFTCIKVLKCVYTFYKDHFSWKGWLDLILIFINDHAFFICWSFLRERRETNKVILWLK